MALESFWLLYIKQYLGFPLDFDFQVNFTGSCKEINLGIGTVTQKEAIGNGN